LTRHVQSAADQGLSRVQEPPASTRTGSAR
jgi:hypothetical protein